MITCPVIHLIPGQRVDLEADVFADPDYHASGDPTASEHPEFQFGYEVVLAVERESEDCIRVDFESGFSCGFDHQHAVEIDPEQHLGDADR